VRKQPHQQLIQAFKDLLKETQALLQVQGLSDEEILAEIKACRAVQ
jgi:hypothetical protein